MKKNYYGLSMGLIRQTDRPTNHISESNYFVHIMKDLIQEFNKIGADCIFLKRDLSELGDFINEMAVEGYVIFSFQTEEYFSDVLKNAELVVEDFAIQLVGAAKTSREKVDNAIAVENFKMCFKPYCIEKAVPDDLSKQSVVDIVLEELKEVISRGRGIPLVTKPSIVNLLLNRNFSAN
ncbi:hypothetical protein [Roseivirga sp. E12]|uniref:hypothetical protein n=1 Tax=Roseivirga sp. E12 TaxID=2819237 RepID=UPI001ABC3E88|nr:hypothetical protein [Roseivirga sp. E12]MBO3698493.1 hypothetical protein [Roseivirga sp. E12]